MRILDCQAWDKVSDITEVWKPIEGYEDKYLISNTGKVKSLYRNIILKPKTDKDGYKEVSLHKNGKSKTKKIHRLVAYAFIPNPNNLPQVNHKNENKENNHVENLEWCTSEYNNNYGTHNERASVNRKGKKHKKHKFKKQILCIETDEIFDTSQDVINIMFDGKGDSSTIRANSRGKIKSAYGYHFKYIERENY